MGAVLILVLVLAHVPVHWLSEAASTSRGPSCELFGPTWGNLGSSWDLFGHLGTSWGHLGASCGHLGAILGSS